MGTISTVDFKDDTLFAVERDDGRFLAVTPVCRSLGLDAQKQRNRIEADPILAEGVCQVAYPSAGGVQDMFCLRLDLVNGWLFSINDKMVKEEARERVLAYKRECYAVLFRHFYGRPLDERANGLSEKAADVTAEEPLSSRRKLVTEARQTFGNQAGREMWFKMNLPTVPAMYADPRQGEFFTYTAIRRDPEPGSDD
ncbi:phage antirepressor N-terminal domain-containing protein [Methylobacterium komagatae]|uniref:Phage antirepressor N-terminal domain-containing protein n=1 Tax=Methylobacterium komagatae TaxID=374425 RepID=A0ABW2BKG6_9HYPH